MGVKLPSPREWLDGELQRRSWTGRELERRSGMPSSSIAKFAAGEAGPQICIDLAAALAVSPLETLAVNGLIPPPPRSDDLRWGSIGAAYNRLDEGGRGLLLDYAQFLVYQQSQARASAGRD